MEVGAGWNVDVAFQVSNGRRARGLERRGVCMKRTRTMRVSNRRAADGGFGLEAMEGRQLLAADLAIAWDTANFHLPSVVVPGDRFNPDGGTDRLEVPLQIINVGTTAAVGTVRLDFYLSLDTTLNPGTDILMRSYTGEPLSLSVYTGDPNDIGTLSPDMFIPAGTAPGTYFLIVRVIPDSNIGDFNQSNNLSVSDDPVALARRFGDFSGRTNVALTLVDTDGTQVRFTQTGGGYGEVAPSADGFGVTIFNGGVSSSVSVVVGTGGDGKYDFTSIAINGSVGSFNAPQGRLRGPLTATTGFGAMTFGDVVGPLTITVPATSQTPSFTLGNVSELSINSAVGIDSITVTSWFDTAGPTDVIRAPWLGSLTSTNNFYPNIRLSGRGGGQPTLGPVNITGVIKRGSWSINGIGSTLNIFATTVFWSASYNGPVTSLTTGGSYRGVFTASSIGSITSGRDILLSHILAGAYLGDDGVFGGSGANADTYGAGTIGTIDVFHNIAGVTIAAGLSPVDGVFRNGNDAIIGGTASSIGRVTVGNIFGAVARLITNVHSGPVTVNGVALNTSTNTRFASSAAGPTSVLQSATVSDIGGAPTVSISVRFNSSGLISRNTIVGTAIRVTGPGGFESLGILVSNPFDAPSNQRAAFGNFTVQLAGVGGTAAAGTYTIEVLGGIVADTRGRTALAGVLGTFDVM